MNNFLTCSFCGTVNPPTECLCLNCSQPLNLWQDITSVSHLDDKNIGEQTLDDELVDNNTINKMFKMKTCPNDSCQAEIDTTRLSKSDPKCPYCNTSIILESSAKTNKQFFLEFPWGREELNTTVQFGRDPSKSTYANQLHPKYDNISREHAELIFSPHKILIRDLGSTNGTYVNETRLFAEEVVTLKHGDRIRLAKHFVFLFIEYNKA